MSDRFPADMARTLLAMPLKYQHRVLTHLAHPSYEPKALGPLGVELGFADDMQAFKDAVLALRDSGEIDVDDDGIVSLDNGEGYTRHYRYLTRLELPAMILDLDRRLPPAPITTIAPAASGNSTSTGSER